MSPMQMIRDEIKQLRIRTETIDLILRDTPSALLAIVDAYCRHMGIAESAVRVRKERRPPFPLVGSEAWLNSVSRISKAGRARQWRA